MLTQHSRAWRTLIASTALLLAGSLAGCAPPAAEVVVKRPARYPQAAQARKIAVLGFGGSAGGEVSEHLEAELASAELDGRPFFTVVNARGRLPAAAAERASIPDLQRLGRRLGVDAVYTGSASFQVQRQNYSEQRSECLGVANAKKLVSRCTNTHNYTVACQRVIASVTVTPRVVAVGQAATLYSRSVGKSAKDEG